MRFLFDTKNDFREIDEVQLKAKTRILFIDDVKNEVIDAIEREGWKVKHIFDLDKIDNVDLIDSHIICVDIKGVGGTLGFKDEGLDVVKAIKEQYPFKRIILYSSVQYHDIFHDALKYVDKRVYKDGQAYNFIKAIKEVSKLLFDWDTMITDIFERYKNSFSNEMTKDVFSRKMKKTIRGEAFDKNAIIKITGASLAVASDIVTLGSVFFK